MICGARLHRLPHECQPVAGLQVLVVEEVCVAQEAGIGGRQKRWGYICEVAHYQHRQVGVRSIESAEKILTLI